MNTDILIGAIAGDIIGSYYEFVPMVLHHTLLMIP